MLGLGCGLLVLLSPIVAFSSPRAFSCRSGSSRRGSSSSSRDGSAFFEQVLTSRLSTEGNGSSTHFLVYDFIPTCSRRTRSSVSGSTRSRCSTSSRPGRRTSGRTPSTSRSSSRPASSEPRLRLVPDLSLPPGRRDQAYRAGARRGRRPARGAGLAARLGSDGCARRDLASNFFYLTMSFYYFFVVALLAIAAPAVFSRRLTGDVKVAVLTTSYPRDADESPACSSRRRRRAARAGVELVSYRPRPSAITGSPMATGS